MLYVSRSQSVLWGMKSEIVIAPQTISSGLIYNFSLSD